MVDGMGGRLGVCFAVEKEIGFVFLMVREGAGLGTAFRSRTRA